MFRGSGSRRGLILAVWLYLYLGAGMLDAVPPWEAPDETWHAAYAEALAAGSLPTLEQTYEAHHPPLYYLWPAAWMRILDRHPLPAAEHNPYYPFATSVFLHPPGEPLAPVLRLLRFLSSLLVLPAMALVGSAATTLAKARWPEGRSTVTPLLAMLLFGLWPQWLFLSHTINNDTAAVLAGALLGAGVVRALLMRQTPPRGAPAAWTLLGLGAAAAVGAKLTAAVLLPAVGLALLAAGLFEARSAVRRRRGEGDALVAWRLEPAARRRVRTWVGSVLSLAAGAAIGLLLMRLSAPSAWDHLRSLFVARAELEEGLSVPVHWPSQLGLLAESAWGRLGWMNLRLPAASLASGALLVFGGMLGFVGGLLRARSSVRFASLALGLLGATALAAVLRNMAVDPQAQGRLLFPALPAVCVLLAMGWSTWLFALEKPIARRGLITLLVLVPLAADVHLIARGLPSAYSAARALRPPGIFERILPARWLPVAVLHRPGATWRQSLRVSSDDLVELALPVHLAAGRMRVGLRLRDADGRLVAAREQAIQAGAEHHWLRLPLGSSGIAPRRGDRLVLEVEALTSTEDGLVLWGGKGHDPNGQLVERIDVDLLVESAELDLVLVLRHAPR